MGGAADQGVGRVGQSVEHVLPDEPALLGLNQRLQEVVDHLGVHGSFRTKVRKVTVSNVYRLNPNAEQTHSLLGNKMQDCRKLGYLLIPFC